MTLLVSLLGAPLFAMGNRHRARVRGDAGVDDEDERVVPPDVAVAGPTPSSIRESRHATPSPTR
jgi:hypothetical protein